LRRSVRSKRYKK